MLAIFIIAASGGTFTGQPSPLVAARGPHPTDSAAIVDAPARGSDIDYKRLDARLQHLAQQKNMVGLAVGIVEDGRIRFLKGYGTTVAGGDEPVGVDTIFRWASLSKGVAEIGRASWRERVL